MPQRSHDNASGKPEQAMRDDNQSDWQHLVALLPAEAFEQAQAHRAFVRARGLRHPSDLLRGILAYVFCLSSFRQLGCWAASIGLSPNGERAFAKRTRQAASWLLWLLQALLAPLACNELFQVPPGFAGRIHLVDATHLRAWKRNGESRRLHMSYESRWQTSGTGPAHRSSRRGRAEPFPKATRRHYRWRQRLTFAEVPSSTN